jgi:signal transduction histidine kinase
MPGAVVLRVQDDGPGFVGTAGNTPGLGLRSIRDRVAVLGGTIEQGSLVPSGAYVRLRLPLSTTSQGS